MLDSDDSAEFAAGIIDQLQTHEIGIEILTRPEFGRTALGVEFAPRKHARVFGRLDSLKGDQELFVVPPSATAAEFPRVGCIPKREQTTRLERRRFEGHGTTLELPANAEDAGQPSDDDLHD
jgi:hypothetical protein